MKRLTLGGSGRRGMCVDPKLPVSVFFMFWSKSTARLSKCLTPPWRKMGSGELLGTPNKMSRMGYQTKDMYSNHGGGNRNMWKSVTGLNAISCLVISY